MMQHFLQSGEWEKFERSEGRRTFRRGGDGWKAMVTVKETPVGAYLSCPYGPAAENAEKLKEALDSLAVLAREQKAMFVRVEPILPVTEVIVDKLDDGTGIANVLTVDKMKKMGLCKSHDIEPAHTWVLDLDRPEEEILAEIETNKARAWRNMAKKGLSVRQTTDSEEIKILTRFLQKVGEREHFNPQDELHLKRQMEAGFATLYVVDYRGEGMDEAVPIAASLVYDYDGVRYYAHAGADDEYKKLRAGAILLVQMVVDAKRLGMKTFDFWGVTTSDDPAHPWYGFTQFKKSFGGRQVDYAGTWDLVVQPMKYKVYQAVRKVNRGIRKK